jgi:hypothetical protein
VNAVPGLADLAEYERIAANLFEDDPAGRRLYWNAVTVEHGRDLLDLESAPTYRLAVTVIRGVDRLGPRRAQTAVNLAWQALASVADGPLLPLGHTRGKWLYFMDGDGFENSDRLIRPLRPRIGLPFYLDTGVIAFLPWRKPGRLLRDVHEANLIAAREAKRGTGGCSFHISHHELVETGIVRERSRDDAPIFRPLVAA